MNSKRFTIFLFALFFLLGAASQGLAALKSSKNQAPASPEDAFNPQKDELDLELPMPDGQKLILRAVPVPADNGILLYDAPFKMGLVDFDPKRGFYERQMPMHISAPFRQENMPATWKGKLPANEKDSFYYYLIGKYELTNGQWAAVMGEEVEGNPAKPKSDVSWYDLQDFLRKYNEWLLREHPEAVPTIDSVPAFLRLPTEAEWEYAARYGNPGEQQKNPDFPGLSDEHDDVADFAVFGSRYEDKMPIGSRLPNKLGIYDMAGNVAELVQSGFRFVVNDSRGGNSVTRLHGSEGGLLSKGGSYKAANEKEVYPGRRDELRMFEKKGDKGFVPHKGSALGARLVLGSVNVPGIPRTNEILAAEKELGKTPEIMGKGQGQPAVKAAAQKPSAGGGAIVMLDMNGDPVAELEKIYTATQSPEIRNNLKQYRELIRGHNEALHRERSANLLSMIRAGAYKADSLANIAFRCFNLQFELIKAQRAGESNLTDLEKEVKREMRRHFKNLQVATGVYKQSVEEVAEYPKAMVDDKIIQLKKEYSGDDQLNKAFRKNLENFAQNVDFARKNGINKLRNTTIWKQAIPGQKSLAIIMELENSGKSKKNR